MKTYLIVFTLLLCASMTASAQDKDREYKHDIGINTNLAHWSILDNTYIPLSFIYKSYNTPNKAIRLGGQISFLLSDNNGSDENQSQDISKRQTGGVVGITIGREFQHILRKKWMWYYGVDLVPQYAFSLITEYEHGNEFYTHNDYNYYLILQPFVGLRYNVLPMLYVSAEAHALLTYRYSILSQSYNRLTDQPGARLYNNSISLSGTPLAAVSVYYRF